MDGQNLLFIFSDEHRRSAAGCYGHPFVRTPNLDALAKRGTVFDNAYTPSPICVPARGALATGEWVHRARYWDNVFSFHGERPSWHGRLKEMGHDTAAMGKLHFRKREDDNGFRDEIDTMHIIDGVGDLIGSIRNPPPPPRAAMPLLAKGAGPGDCTYNDYDRRVAEHAVRWIQAKASRPDEKPWALMVSFARPHYPLTAPQEFFDLYDPDKMELPETYRQKGLERHPWINELARTINYGDHFKDDHHRRVAMASYYALVTFLDHNIGVVLKALEDAGLSDSTRIVYSSDHGDNVADRGLWGKSTMYEESAAIPMIMAGPGVPRRHRVKTPVSLVDIYATAIESLGQELSSSERKLPSRSLWDFIQNEEPDRSVISEYHAMGSRNASFMLRYRQWKYIYYVGHEPELFNLENDPGEANNLAAQEVYKEVLADCERRLREYCDPEMVDEEARNDQNVMLASFGGAAAIIGRGDVLYSPTPGESTDRTHHGSTLSG